ncbi:MAG: hypothetical protein ABEI75_05125 [Halobaculum sp.]
MGTKQIRVSESYHAYLKSKQRDGETLGETAERLSRDYGLTDFAEDVAELDLDRSVREATDGAVEAPTSGSDE